MRYANSEIFDYMKDDLLRAERYALPPNLTFIGAKTVGNVNSDERGLLGVKLLIAKKSKPDKPVDNIEIEWQGDIYGKIVEKYGHKIFTYHIAVGKKFFEDKFHEPLEEKLKGWEDLSFEGKEVIRYDRSDDIEDRGKNIVTIRVSQIHSIEEIIQFLRVDKKLKGQE